MNIAGHNPLTFIEEEAFPPVKEAVTFSPLHGMKISDPLANISPYILYLLKRIFF